MTKSERKRLCAACRAMFPGQKIPLFQKALRKQRKEKQEQERLTKKGARAAVRKAVDLRAGLWCECGCGTPFGLGEQTAEMDHFYGKRYESRVACWMLTRACHHRKTENEPTRRYWTALWEAHCTRHGYPFTPRFGGRPKADAAQQPSEALKAIPMPVASSTQEGETRDPPPETA